MSTGSTLLNDPYFDGTPSANVSDLRNEAIGEGHSRIRLTKAIGRGTWSTVYQGESVSDPSKTCAVKCMAMCNMDPHQQDTVSREVELHAICADASPHVLRIHDVIEDSKGHLFIITDLCEKRTLLDYINDGEFIDNDERIRETFVQILDAVEACHGQGIYHRDLKPENILFQDGGKKVILGDFGFATRKKTTEQFCLGTRPYMSPEVLGGFGVKLKRYSSPRADIWALGVIFMALIASCPPWSEASAEAKDYRYPDECITDDRFLAYALFEPDYLYNAFPISRDTNEILKSIFTLEPRRRTSITDLRTRILNVKTFSRETEPEMMADFESIELHAVNSHVPEEADVTDAPIGPYINSEFPSPPEDLQLLSVAEEDEDALDTSIAGEVALSLLVEADITESFAILESDSDAESDYVESEGPITPETHAVDNATIAAVGDAGVLEDIDKIDLGEVSAVVFAASAEAQYGVNVNGVSEKKKTNPVARADKGTASLPPLPKRSPLRLAGIAR
ncbi:kinase-like protein [Sanghuangporus baumii]|uniref:Kinase-like protein n=1 Tax=Sanghuangporus baumii TaxID=108892 RepID=A0A9Q5NBA6_SANBA|nr:kinase-like protein [Sanghuangporus baumii]